MTSVEDDFNSAYAQPIEPLVHDERKETWLSSVHQVVRNTENYCHEVDSTIDKCEHRYRLFKDNVKDSRALLRMSVVFDNLLEYQKRVHDIKLSIKSAADFVIEWMHDPKTTQCVFASQRQSTLRAVMDVYALLREMKSPSLVHSEESRLFSSAIDHMLEKHRGLWLDIES